MVLLTFEMIGIVNSHLKWVPFASQPSALAHGLSARTYSLGSHPIKVKKNHP